jgi:hypothetical protein
MLDDSAARRAPNDGSIELLEFQPRRVATPALLRTQRRGLYRMPSGANVRAGLAPQTISNTPCPVTRLRRMRGERMRASAKPLITRDPAAGTGEKPAQAKSPPPTHKISTNSATFLASTVHVTRMRSLR